jgi:hypothetical protein
MGQFFIKFRKSPAAKSVAQGASDDIQTTPAEADSQPSMRSKDAQQNDSFPPVSLPGISDLQCSGSSH